MPPGYTSPGGPPLPPWRSRRPRWPRTSLGNVLSLLDARTGSYAEVRSARRGLLRVCAQVLEAAGGSDLAGLRVLLVADLLVRTAELRDGQLLTALAGQDSAQSAALERAADALNIHPPAVRAGPGEAWASLGGPIDVHLVGDDADVDGGQTGLVARVGPVRPREAGPPGESAAGLTRSRPGSPCCPSRIASRSTSPRTRWPRHARHSPTGVAGSPNGRSCLPGRCRHLSRTGSGQPSTISTPRRRSRCCKP
jgi:hypothetical protein